MSKSKAPPPHADNNHPRQAHPEHSDDPEGQGRTVKTPQLIPPDDKPVTVTKAEKALLDATLNHATVDAGERAKLRAAVFLERLPEGTLDALVKAKSAQNIAEVEYARQWEKLQGITADPEFLAELRGKVAEAASDALSQVKQPEAS